MQFHFIAAKFPARFELSKPFFGSLTCTKQRFTVYLAILYADRRKSPGVPGAAMAIFTDRRDWRIKSPISGIASENREQISPLIHADTLGDFLRLSRQFGTLISFPDYVQAMFRVRVRHFEKSWDKIGQPDWLTLVAIRSDERKKPRERAHLANAGKFNRRNLTCQISAILFADRGDRRKSPSPHRAHLAIFADRRDRL